MQTNERERAKAGWLARTYIPELSADRWYSLEDLLGAMDDSDGWQKRVSEIQCDMMIERWRDVSG